MGPTSTLTEVSCDDDDGSNETTPTVGSWATKECVTVTLVAGSAGVGSLGTSNEYWNKMERWSSL